MTRTPPEESVCRHCERPIRLLHGYGGEAWFHLPKVPQAKAYRFCRDVCAEPKDRPGWKDAE